ncbi:ricin-type beta-trefoil lectin domain protein [Streptomyces olivoreticuli]
MNLKTSAKRRGLFVASVLCAVALAFAQGTASAATGDGRHQSIGKAGAHGLAQAPASFPLKNVGAAGYCLDDPNFNTANGTQLDLWTCNGGANQQWSANGTTSGVTLQVGGKCMDTKEGSTARLTPVVLFGCNGSGSQQWTIEPNGNIYKNGSANQCLFPNEQGSSYQGAPIVLSDCTDSAIDKWQMS